MAEGLAIQLLTPSPNQTLREGEKIGIRAFISLTCGCPTASGGRWDYRRFRVVARLIFENSLEMEISLEPTKNTGEFSGDVQVKKRGQYLLEVTGYDPQSGFAGRTHVILNVKRPG